MKAVLTTVAQRLDDAMNPIVVKELRQAVAGRFVTAVLMLFLVVQLFVIGIALVNMNPSSYNLESGREVFMILLAIMLGTCLLFIPAYASIRLGAERSDTNVDLLYITTISPWKVVWGKYLSALVVVVLIYSACLPFLSLTFLMRGIDLPTIFLMLGFDFLVVAACVMFSLFLACFPVNRVLKALLALITLGILCWAYGLTVMFTWEMMRWGLAAVTGTTDFWLAVVTILLSFGGAIGLMFILAVAMVSPHSANRALPIRLYVMGYWALSFAWALGCSIHYSQDEPIAVWLVVMTIILYAGLLVAISERHKQGPRVLNHVPRRSSLRPFAFVLFSGSAGGVLWIILMLALTLGAAAVCYATFSWSSWADLDEALAMMTPFSLYVVAYCLTAAVVRRAVFPKWIAPAYTWALALILFILGSVVPFIFAFLFDVDDWGADEAWTVTIPFRVFDTGDWDELGLVFSSLWAVAVFAVTLPWIFSCYRDFMRTPLSTPPGYAEQVEAERHRGVEDLRVWTCGNGELLTTYGIADHQMFHLELIRAKGEAALAELEKGALPEQLQTRAGRLFPLDEIQSVTLPKKKKYLVVTWHHGGTPSHLWIPATSVPRRDDFALALQEAAGLERTTRDARLRRAITPPAVAMGIVALFTFFAYMAASDISAGTAPPIAGSRQGLKQLATAVLEAAGPLGALGVGGLVFLACVAWLIARIHRPPQEDILAPPEIESQPVDEQTPPTDAAMETSS